jgi:hypothetical protein
VAPEEGGTRVRLSGVRGGIRPDRILVTSDPEYTPEEEVVMIALLLSFVLAQEPTAPVVAGRDAVQPQLAIDVDGAFYAAFIAGGNVQVAVSTDRGTSFGAPVVAIDAGGRAKGGMQRGPRIAVDGKKTVYVTAPLCFDEAEFSKRYPTQDLYLAASTDGGKSFGKPVRVNDVPKKAPESLHWMAASANGDVHVAWLDLRQREKGQDLFYAKVTEQGKKVSKNVPVAGPLCECCAPGMAVDGKGNPLLMWREGQKSNRALFLALSSNGGASFGKTMRINQGESRIDS